MGGPGGRGYLWGAAVGALLVNYGYSALTSDMPRAWPFFEGGMFLAVVMLFPSGLVGLWEQFEREIPGRTPPMGCVRTAAGLSRADRLSERLALVASRLRFVGVRGCGGDSHT